MYPQWSVLIWTLFIPLVTILYKMVYCRLIISWCPRTLAYIPPTVKTWKTKHVEPPIFFTRRASQLRLQLVQNSPITVLIIRVWNRINYSYSDSCLWWRIFPAHPKCVLVRRCLGANIGLILYQLQVSGIVSHNLTALCIISGSLVITLFIHVSNSIILDILPLL